MTKEANPQLASMARAFARSAEEAERLLAEMLQASAGAPTAGLRPALEVCRAHARRRRLERTVAEKLAATELPISARGDPAAGDEFPAALEDTLSRLEASQAEVLRLCALGGLSTAEAAAILNAPEESVRRALFRGRRHLADLLTSGREAVV
jgi:DNA-directed RNA polymerase specialized sigma24 family protein